MRRVRHAAPRSRLLFALSTVAVGAMMSAASLGGLLFASPPGSAGASSPCPAHATCVSMPGDAGNIVATPTTGLANDQWVNLSFSGFQSDPAVTLYVYLCQNTQPLSAGAPNCVEHGTSDLLFPYNDLKVFSTGAAAGTGDIPFQVGESSTAVPFEGFPPDAAPVNKPIVCDGSAANPCSIVIQEPLLAGGGKNVDATDAAVIPLSFTSSSGCPSATLLPTVSEYGIEQLLPAVAQQACAEESSPVLALNTAINGESAVSDLASGFDQVAFTDDPEAPDEQTQLHSIKGGYALIPVALSANVVGFRAVVPDDSALPPLYVQTTYSLTPTQVAGLVSAYYTSPGASDLLECDTPGYGGWCSFPDNNDCSGDLCSLMAELNGQPGFLGPSFFAASVRSDSSGVTQQLFDWLCNAPNTPYSIFGVSVTEPAPASSVLLNGINANLPSGDSHLTSCPATSDTFPSLQSAGTEYYSEVAQPFQQLVKLAGPSGLVQPTSSAHIAAAAFAPMNWAEADFNGFSISSLENNQGDFVQPTAASLDSAIKDATLNPDGSLSFDYSGTGSAASYPMPDLIYAAVPKAPKSASNVSQERSMLNSILDVTGGAHTADLPGGFVPLPSSLYNEAEKDLTTDIVTQPSTSTTTTKTATKTTTKTTTKTGSSTSGSNTATGSSLSSTSLSACPACAGAAAGVAGAAGALLNSSSDEGSSKDHGHGGREGASNRGSQPLPPVVPAVTLDPTADRMLLPALGVLGAVILLWGLLLLSPPARRGLLAVVAGADNALRGRRRRKSAAGDRMPVGGGGA